MGSIRGAYKSELVAVSMAWDEKAACADPSLTKDQRDAYFWDGERSAAKRQAALEAAERCRSCPVQAECLDYALRHPRPHGIWAGLTLEERDRIAKRRRIAS